MGGAGTIFRDVITLALAGFVAIVLMMLPFLNPPREESREDTTPPGNVIFEIRWPDEHPADVDLWIKCPGDIPVGYSNLNGRVCNLLRDDLGNYNDMMGVNFENAYSRGLPPGEYVANVHLYNPHGGKLPVRVTMAVSVRHEGGKGKTKTLFETAVELSFTSQEITVVRFSLDENGRYMPDTRHSFPMKLRGR